LKDRRQFGAGGSHPLEFVERDDELARTLPALLDQAERGGPVRGGLIGQQRLAQREGGGAQKLSDLQLGRGDLSRDIQGWLAGQELDEQFALAHTTPAIDR